MPRRASAAATKFAPGKSAPLFAALGDETRLLLVSRLSRGGPRSIAKLTEGVKITRQAVTKHLYVMEEVGLVRATRAGRESVWALEHGRLEEARSCLEHLSQQWNAALERLIAHVEK